MRVELQEFSAEAFASLPRKDQRYWGSVYLRGLILDGERKSVEPISQRLPEADRQSLQQFLADSPWQVAPVRAAMARRMSEVIKPEAVVFDDTGFPKCGLESPGVARQYSGTLGKTGSCQVAVTTHLATDNASYPANWRLFLPEAQWDPASAKCADVKQVAARRARCKIPQGEGHREKWRLALDSLDELHAWGVKVPVALADAGYGDCFEFRQGLAERDLHYVVGVTPTLVAHPAAAERRQPPYPGTGPHKGPVYPDKPQPLATLAAAAGARAARTVAWREGTKTSGARLRTLRSRFLAIRVRPAGLAIQRRHQGSDLPECWLLAEWPRGQAAPVQFWLSNLPADTPLKTLVRLAKLRWRIEHDYREMKTGLGLDHFEGRTWVGFHHHVTCVALAHAFLTRLRLGKDPAVA